MGTSQGERAGTLQLPSGDWLCLMFFSLKTAKARQGEANPCWLVKCILQEGATNFCPSPPQPVLPLRSWKPSQAPLLYYLCCGTMELILKTTSESPASTLRLMPTQCNSVHESLPRRYPTDVLKASLYS